MNARTLFPATPSHYRTPLLTLLLAFLTLAACSGGGGGGDSETLAWVRIDAPADGYASGADTILVKGNAAMRNGDYPQTIYWYANGGSGVAYQSVGCLIACIAAFQAPVPLVLGENTITVTMADGSDQVTVTRYNQVVVRGRITSDNPEWPSVADLPVTLSGSAGTYTSRSDDSGYFQLAYVGAGDYTLAPQQPMAPQSDVCYTFSPANRAVMVPADDGSDIMNQDFVANILQPCYYIQGRVTYAINPDLGVQNLKMTLTDRSNNTLVRYTTINGDYTFYNLAPGDYVVTPADCTVESCTGYTPSYHTITVTDSNAVLQDFTKE